MPSYTHKKTTPDDDKGKKPQKTYPQKGKAAHLTNLVKSCIMEFEGTRLFRKAFAKAKTFLKSSTGSIFVIFRSTKSDPKRESVRKGHLRPKGRGDSMKTLFKRFGALIAVIAAAAVLSACGGGGGGSVPDPVQGGTPPPVVDTTPPVLTLATASPASTTTTIVVTSDDALSGLVALTVQSSNGAVISGSTTPSSGNHGFTWASMAGALPCNTVFKLSAQATNVAGLSTTQSFTLSTVACPQVAWWPPATDAPIGMKVNGLNTLSSTPPVTIGDSAWQQAVKNGTVKFADTGAVMTGFDTRPIVWAVMQYNSQWCAVPVHKDDGSAVGNFTSPGSVCNTEPFDWFDGTGQGLVRHFPGRSQCYQYQWNAATVRFDDLLVTCP